MKRDSLVVAEDCVLSGDEVGRTRPNANALIVGTTGCGKSTLLNVAAGLLAPSTGSVRVFGQPLQGINARAGYMFQAESLMPWRTALAIPSGIDTR